MVSEPHLYGTELTGQWVTDCSPSEVQECFGGWEPEVEEMLKVNPCVSARCLKGYNRSSHLVHRTTDEVGHS